jgi:integrase
VFSEWWQRGADLATLAAVTGRGWHSLRRQFATELKHVPLKDLAELGGWKCAQTILTCYQQADQATMRQALATRHRLEARA